MIIAGAGGHAKEVVDEWLKAGGVLEDLEFFDEVHVERTFLGRPVHAQVRDLGDHKQFMVAVGDPEVRKDLFERFILAGNEPVSLVAQSAQVSSLAKALGQGLNIMALAVVGPDAELGDGVLLNSGAHIHHDAFVGAFSEISPRVSVLGGAWVGPFARIGTGATILPGIRVGERAVVGAGAVVDRDVPPRTMVVGVPARSVST